MTQNFDPTALVKDVSTALAKVQPIIAQVEAIANTIAPMLAIFAPFLPAPIGTAVQDLPTIIAKMEQLNTFIDTQLPQLQALLATSVAGVGVTEATTVAATEVGTFSGSAEAKPLPVAPPGMEFVTMNGQTVLRPKATIGT